MLAVTAAASRSRVAELIHQSFDYQDGRHDQDAGADQLCQIVEIHLLSDLSSEGDIQRQDSVGLGLGFEKT